MTTIDPRILEAVSGGTLDRRPERLQPRPELPVPTLPRPEGTVPLGPFYPQPVQPNIA
jgi:hypothetical protein